jgi:hypothetical protein|tara:strand:- start:1 stop:240 length:240 start_codon:yes stop_codon:yes gene_type:complete
MAITDATGRTFLKTEYLIVLANAKEETMSTSQYISVKVKKRHSKAKLPLALYLPIDTIREAFIENRVRITTPKYFFSKK